MSCKHSLFVCFLSHSGEGLLILASGNLEGNNLVVDSQFQGETMLLSADLSDVQPCPKNSLPYLDLQGLPLVGGLLAFEEGGGQNKTPVACGILSEHQDSSLNCVSMVNGEHVHNRNRNVVSYRNYAAAVVVNNGTGLWITGGKDFYDTPLFTTYLLDANGTHPWIELHLGLYGHGLALIQGGGRQQILAIGGCCKPDFGDFFGDPWLFWESNCMLTDFDWHKEIIVSEPVPYAWEDFLPMVVSDRIGHMTGVLKLVIGGNMLEIVIAAGGYYEEKAENFDYFSFFFFGFDYYGSIEQVVLDSVDILRVQNGQVFDAHWELGPKLPLPLANSASAVTHDQSRMFVIGGWTSLSPLGVESKNIYSIDCLSGGRTFSCSWNEHNLELWWSGTSFALFLAPHATLVSSSTYYSIYINSQIKMMP